MNIQILVLYILVLEIQEKRVKKAISRSIFKDVKQLTGKSNHFHFKLKKEKKDKGTLNHKLIKYKKQYVAYKRLDLHVIIFYP